LLPLPRVSESGFRGFLDVLEDPGTVRDALDLEGRREGISYSIETLRELHSLYNTGLKLFFIIGVDAFLEIDTWREYKELFNSASFIVIERPGFSFNQFRQYLDSLELDFRKGDDPYTRYTPSGNLLSFAKTTLIDISSSKIRELVASGKSIRFLVPESVRSFILKKRLYIPDGNN